MTEVKLSGMATRVRLYSVWRDSGDFYTLLMSTTVRNDAYDACTEGRDIMTEHDVWVEVPR